MFIYCWKCDDFCMICFLFILRVVTMTSPLAWFATPRGRQASLIISGLASATTFCVYYTPHTFFLSKYKDIISVYQ